VFLFRYCSPTAHAPLHHPLSFAIGGALRRPMVGFLDDGQFVWHRHKFCILYLGQAAKRGGSWNNNPFAPALRSSRNCRSAYRNNNNPGDHKNNIGFRVVCEARALFSERCTFRVGRVARIGRWESIERAWRRVQTCSSDAAASKEQKSQGALVVQLARTAAWLTHCRCSWTRPKWRAGLSFGVSYLQKMEKPQWDFSLE